MKIYCKNCKYVIGEVWDGFYRYHCRYAFKFEKYVDTAYARMRVDIFANCKNIEEINENNDCKDYKRKWWKFWVK